MGPGLNRKQMRKSPRKSPRPILVPICWGNVPCVCCVFMLLNVVSRYALCVLSMSVISFQNKSFDRLWAIHFFSSFFSLCKALQSLLSLLYSRRRRQLWPWQPQPNNSFYDTLSYYQTFIRFLPMIPVSLSWCYHWTAFWEASCFPHDSVR